MTNTRATRQTRATRSAETAEAAFVAHKIAIDQMLARLAAHSANHFGVEPDAVNWGHVGTLAHYAELLKRITDAAFLEGEYAD